MKGGRAGGWGRPRGGGGGGECPTLPVQVSMRGYVRASPAIMPVAGWQCAHMCALAWSRAPYTRHAADMTVRARFFMSGRA